MLGFSYLGGAVGVAAAAGQERAFVVETDVVDQGIVIVGEGLLEGPEIIICGSHEQGAVVYGVLFIAAVGWILVFFCQAVEALDEGFESGGDGPKVQGGGKCDQVGFFYFGYELVEIIFLYAWFSIAAGVAACAAVYLEFV